ncbi:hypothetical protein LCGC14_1069980, partial [marine sediment metagenome]
PLLLVHQQVQRRQAYSEEVGRREDTMADPKCKLCGEKLVKDSSAAKKGLCFWCLTKGRRRTDQ